jgi:hypothetical protein
VTGATARVGGTGGEAGGEGEGEGDEGRIGEAGPSSNSIRDLRSGGQREHRRCGSLF